MEISGRLAQIKLQRNSFRVLSLGICVAIVALTGITAEQTPIAGTISALLLTIAAFMFGSSLYKSFPSESATLHPVLKLPKSLINGGLNCADEPIEYWICNPLQKSNIILGTKYRRLELHRSCLSEEQWTNIVSALPPDRKLTMPEIREAFSPALLIYSLLLTATHFLLDQPAELPLFNYLAHGGYNATMLADTDFYRMLSYSWVHANDLHLWVNLFALLVMAQTLGKSFSNATLVTVLITTAVISALIGNLGKDFNVLVGASGAIMGLFGFLCSAQKNRDERLNPLYRVARQKLLYLLLLAELALSLSYSWYGGTVHIVGVVTGYGIYKLMQRFAHKPHWQARSQWSILSLGCVLFLSWGVHTYQAINHPKQLAERALNTEDPFLVFLASTALPDLPNATRTEVLAARQQTIDLLSDNELKPWPLARIDYWLGDNTSALAKLRSFSALEPGSEEVRGLWLSVERDIAVNTELGDPISILPAGPATAYLISAKLDVFARINLPIQQTPVSAVFPGQRNPNWHLLSLEEPLIKPRNEVYGAWPIPTHRFRTAQTAKLVAGEPR